MSKSITQDVNVSDDGNVDVQQKVYIDGQSIDHQVDGGTNVGQSVSCSNLSDEFELEKHLHQQYAATNDANLGILVAFLGTLIGVFAMFGYVFVNSDNAFSKDFGRLIIHCGESIVFHLDVLFLAAAVTLMIISILYRFSLHLGVDQRKEQFLIFAIRLKYYNKENYKNVFPPRYCPMNKKCIFDIAQGLYGKICKMLIFLYFLIIAATLIKAFAGTCTHCCCRVEKTFESTQGWTISLFIGVFLISLFAAICATKKARCEYQNRVNDYKTLTEDCPYKTDEGCCKPVEKDICCFCKWFAVLALFLFLPFMMSAQVDDWDGSAVQWTHGSGTETDPYLIESAENLAWIAEMVNNGVTTYTGVYFLMTTDLNLKNLQWSPIGNSATNSFQGNFDGGAHFIDSLYINSSTLQYGGLFGYIKNSTIQRVGVNANVTRPSSSSSIPYIGGICGYCTGTPAFLQCYNTGNVSSSSYYYSSYSGGICGYCNSTTTIVSCYNTGNVSSSSSSISSSSSYSGGICAYNSISDKCYNIGTVSSSSSSSSSYSYSGGISNNAQCTNCYNLGTIKHGPSNGNMYAAGIGYNSTAQNCYNVGTLSSGYKCGCASGTNTNSYYLETCGATTGGVSKTESAMKSASFPIMLNADSSVFVIDVTPNVNNGYPIFQNFVCNVVTQAASNIFFNSAVLNGYYETERFWPGGDADVVGFDYKPAISTQFTTVYTNVGSPASYSLTGLESGTSYDYRMFIEKDGVTYYGRTLSFTTLQCDIAATISATSTSICAGDTATLTAEATSSLSNDFTYIWSNNSTTQSINVTDPGTYTVTVTDGNGCVTTASKTIVVNARPVGSINGNTTPCIGQSTTLTASGANRYLWSTGSTAPAITVSESGTYSCIFTNTAGCTSTKSMEVRVFERPVINGDSSFCSGGSTVLTATGNENFVWNTGEHTASITVSTPGTYTVTGSSSSGCSGNTSITVIENQLPEVSILGYPIICSGIGTTLTATEGSSYIWNTGAATRAISANAPGTYSVLVTDENGCSNTTSIEVSSFTRVDINGNTTICQGESTTLSVDWEGTYQWSNGANTSFITVNTANNYAVTVMLPNGCSASASANVVVNPLPVPTISGNTTICQGETTSLTANGGVSYQWSNGANTPSISVSNSGVYSVIATNAYGCTNTTHAAVTVNPLPMVTIGGNNFTCQGSSTTLIANGAQYYQWSNGTSGASISVNTNGNFTVRGFNEAGCSNAASATVTVYPTFNTPISESICQGESYNFFGQILTTSGTYTHTLYSTRGCDSVITLTLTVKERPTVSITGNTTFCQGESSILYANGGSSYLWSNGTTGSYLLVSSTGTYSVTVTDLNGCTNTASTYVTVNPLPVVSISGNTATCQGYNITLTANGADTYLWNTGSTTASISVNASGKYTVTGYNFAGCSNVANTFITVNPSYNTPISESICQGESYNFFGQNLTTSGTYTHALYSTRGCDSVITLTLTVNELPTLTISGNTNFCQGASSILFVSGAANYRWNTGINGNSIMVSEEGTYTVVGTDLNGCSNTASTYVTVNPLPVVSISGNNFACQGNTTTLLANGAANYQWNNGSTNASITVGASGNFSVTGYDEFGCSKTVGTTVTIHPTANTPISESICQGESYNFFGQNLTTAGVYTHTLFSQYGCDSIITLTLSIKQKPTVSISGNTTFCQGSSSSLVANGGISYYWNTGSQNSNLQVSESGDYTVIGTNAVGCSASATAHVTVNPRPMASISGNTSICQGESTTLTANGGTSYLWSNTATASSIIVSNAGTYSVTVTNTYGCSSSVNATVIVNPLPSVSITGNTTTCQGSSTTLVANGAQNYIWSNGSSNASISVETSGTYSVTGYNSAGCSNSASTVVTILPTYNTPISHSMCQGESYNFFGQNLTVGGTYTHTLFSSRGCDSIIILTLTVKQKPNVSISGNTTFCQGESSTLFANGGSNYTWNNGSHNSSLQVSESGDYTVTTINSQGCSASATAHVTVNPLPVVSIRGNTSTCQGSTTTLMASGAQNYLWSNGSTNSNISVGASGVFTVTGFNEFGCSSTASTIVTIFPSYNTPISYSMCQGESYNFFGQNLTTSGTYTHTLFSQYGCDSVITLTLTVKELPAVSISGNTNLCQGETGTLMASGGISYLWSNGSNNSSISVSATGSYSVTATNFQGCSATTTAYVTVSALPNITISGNTHICQGNTTTLAANGAVSYQWSNGASGPYNTVGEFGIYTVTGTNAEGCSNTATTTVAVYTLPVITISGNTEICQGSTTTVTANGAISYVWNNGLTSPSLTTSAAGTYMVIGTDANGCQNAESVIINVNYPTYNEISVTECDSYEWNGVIYSESGDYTWIGQTSHGCDSTIILHLTINESTYEDIYHTADSSFEWNGIIFTTSGDYYWFGQTSKGCDSTVTLHLTITTGISSYASTIKNIKVYPNPTQSICNVECDIEDAELRLIDITGKQVLAKKTDGEVTQLDVSSLAPGIYVLHIVANNKIVGTAKVVHQ